LAVRRAIVAECSTKLLAIRKGEKPKPDHRRVDPDTANLYRELDRIHNKCGRKTKDTLAELEKPEHKGVREMIASLHRKIDPKLIEAATKWRKANQPPT
jgi:hypothetical protein